MGKYLSIVGQSLLYPFKEIGGLLIPFLLTLLLLLILQEGLGYLYFMILSKLLDEGWSAMSVAVYFGPVYNLLLLILWGMVVVPLYVAVSRNVVINEQFQPLILKGFAHSRTYQTMFAWLKVLLIFLTVMVIFGYLNVLIVGDKVSEPLFTVGSVVVVKGYMLPILATLLGLYYMGRASMATVTAAVDAGSSIRNSFRVTGGHALQILFAVLVLFILMGLVGGLVTYIASTFGFMGDPAAMMAMSSLEKLMWLVGMIAVRLLTSIMFVAALAKIYLLITAK